MGRGVTDGAAGSLSLSVEILLKVSGNWRLTLASVGCTSYPCRPVGRLWGTSGRPRDGRPFPVMQHVLPGPASPCSARCLSRAPRGQPSPGLPEPTAQRVTGVRRRRGSRTSTQGVRRQSPETALNTPGVCTPRTRGWRRLGMDRSVTPWLGACLSLTEERQKSFKK